MEAQPTNWNNVLFAVNTLWLLVLSVVTWLRKPGEDASRLSQTNAEELRALKERIEHLVRSDELAELEGTVKALTEKTTGLAFTLDTFRQTLQRVEQYLLTHKP